MGSILDKVNKLIRLATNNPSVEEAKFAALKAVTLIKDNEIKVGKPELINAKSRYRAYDERDRVWQEERERVAREARIRRAARVERERLRQEKLRKEVRETITKKIIVKYKTRCKTCGKDIGVGDVALWTVGGIGIFHPSECWDKWIKNHG